MPLRVIQPPDTWLLTLDQAKQQVNVDFGDDDAKLTRAIKGAQALIEAMTQRRYCAQTLEWVTDELCSPLILPVAPGGDFSKITIESVTYADLNGDMQTLDPDSAYWARPYGATMGIVRRWRAWWPIVGDAAERVVVRFSITSTPADASDAVLVAMGLLVAHYYAHPEAVVGVDNRDSSTPIPFGVEENVSAERW